MKRPALKIKSLCLISAVAGAIGFAPASRGPMLRADEAASQPADERPMDETAIKSAFAALANSDAAVRDEALVRLMGLRSDDLPTLKKVVTENRPLHPAQELVLRRIVTHVYLTGLPYDSNPALGFLGIKMDTVRATFREVSADDPTRGFSNVVVVERMPGFPGARMLQDGDVILSILDQPETPIRETPDFALVVSHMGAGATVHFLLMRQGRVMQVPVKLDPKPMAAIPGRAGGGDMDELLELRHRQANFYWAAEFAPLFKPGVS